MYSEEPGPLGSVLWTSSGAGPSTIPADGCLDLIWHGGALLIAGPSTAPVSTRADATEPTIGVRLAPGTAGLLLPLDPAELRDRLADADTVLPRAAHQRLHAVLGRAVLADARTREARGSGHPQTSGRTRALEAMRGIAEHAAADAASGQVARIGTLRGLAARGSGLLEAAREMRVSERQLRREMRSAFGYGYRTLGRVLRVQRVMAEIRAGMPLGEAAGLGYADQAHMTREFRALAGITPGQLAPPPAATGGGR